jgi:hypothetical protein
MSRRRDFVLALSVALTKDREVSVKQALDCMSVVLGLPDETFPVVSTQAVERFVRHVLDREEAPEWVRVAKDRQGPSVRVRTSTTNPCATWWCNMRATTNPSELLPSLQRLLVDGEATMLAHEWRSAQEWIATIPGDEDDEQPFDVEEAT